MTHTFRPYLQVLCVAAAAVFVMPSSVAAQNAAGCSAPEHRQFDFWIGDWEVQAAAGGIAGTNVITPMLNGCVLHEQWTGNGGTIGESFNIYDRRSGTWHQTWVDSGGTLLRIDGGLEDGAMVLRGELSGPDGSVQQHRVTWTPNDDGSVRQHWEASADGEQWNTLFDGMYRKKGDSE
jgi:hypothetical protein